MKLATLETLLIVTSILIIGQLAYSIFVTQRIRVATDQAAVGVATTREANAFMKNSSEFLTKLEFFCSQRANKMEE